MKIFRFLLNAILKWNCLNILQNPSPFYQATSQYWLELNSWLEEKKRNNESKNIPNNRKIFINKKSASHKKWFLNNIICVWLNKCVWQFLNTFRCQRKAPYKWTLNSLWCNQHHHVQMKIFYWKRVWLRSKMKHKNTFLQSIFSQNSEKSFNNTISWR